MQTILVTGGAGFIGSNLANSYLEQNKVVVIDDLSMGNKDNLKSSDNLTFIEGDVSDEALMENVLQKYQFDYIFHLAAIASVADSVERPIETHEINFRSVLNLLELIKAKQPSLKRLVFASSAAVYGDEPTLPKQEESVIRPLTPYAVDKFAAEKYVTDYQHLYGVPTAAVRFFNVYGPGQNPSSPYSGVISILMDKYKQVMAGQDAGFTLFGEGDQSRDFVFVKDVVNALKLVAESPAALGEVYNVGTGTEVTLKELITVFDSLLGITLPIINEEERLGDIKFSKASIDKITGLGYSPKFNVQEGLREYIDYELSTK
ncbi:NAD-dependent epimerase/dehydratase family protein [Enterococcus sp. BWR-S5]|uniref:NAD-dependent epimerase/dehydratase family protein n=1 Tax=Enterococcus sp. BWR-S5 TaxID=2787714 RepID=UPI0019226163|nr:NAD-dependent epimerase/dehydratase family protein [Enterococcus sp. BWR-S5]MBL1224731.1 NAD-dependent epimerase/dehydratase family protein [Enterococcus sp. BWR-S5]